MNFDFFCVPRIVFGAGKLAAIGELMPPLGTRILVVYNGSQTALGKLRDHLAPLGVTVLPHRQKGEPTVADVDIGLDVARREKCTGVIGLGGGSAIDAAKAIAGLLTNGGSALDYMEVIGAGRKISRPAIPWIAIPTTAGTGAEVTRNAVVGEPSKRFKASIRSEHLLPRVALVDPQLGVDVPPAVTAASGMDALCQCIEAYVSSGANPLTDGLALKGIELAARSLAQAADDGSNLAARTDMAMAALLSGICLTNAGLGAVHGFAAPIGANHPAPHAVVCAALLPHVMQANSDAAFAENRGQLRRKLAEVGRLLADDDRLPEAEAQSAGVAVVAELRRHLKIPRLSQYGLDEAAVAPMVALAKKASSMKFNPVTLSDDTLAEVLRKAL